MKVFLDLHYDKVSYTSFCEDTQKQVVILEDLLQWLTHVSQFQFGLRKGAELGYMLRINYELWNNKGYQDALRYSIGFEGFIDNLKGVHRHWKSAHINFALFGKLTSENTETDVESNSSTEEVFDMSLVFRDQYYPVLLKRDSNYNSECIVKNDLDMKRDMIITGPNASGKTTFLKTTALNLIFTQQLGIGFYSSGKLPKLFTHIHSYLNIPDTSERDSLFQAEARRCKDIIDTIEDNNSPTAMHFCIFDELYSGTNPKEASNAAYAFLKYLSKKKNTRFILTTHYVDVCKRFRKSCRVANYQMMVDIDEFKKMKYTYRIDMGISKVEGAMRILEDMNYPIEIMEMLRPIK
jgi:DNA mismatch repair ATPase MutS